jgi:hypothetical protein
MSAFDSMFVYDKEALITQCTSEGTFHEGTPVFKHRQAILTPCTCSAHGC